MWSDQVSNPGPLTYESGALTTALRGPATWLMSVLYLIGHMQNFRRKSVISS